MNFVPVPTKELLKHQKFISTLEHKKNLQDIKLECTMEIPKVGDLYKWKQDTIGIVDAFVENFKSVNKDECSTDDYVAPKPKWWKHDYKSKVRQSVISAIREINGPNGEINV